MCAHHKGNGDVNDGTMHLSSEHTTKVVSARDAQFKIIQINELAGDAPMPLVGQITATPKAAPRKQAPKEHSPETRPVSHIIRELD